MSFCIPRPNVWCPLSLGKKCTMISQHIGHCFLVSSVISHHKCLSLCAGGRQGSIEIVPAIYLTCHIMTTNCTASQTHCPNCLFFIISESLSIKAVKVKAFPIFYLSCLHDCKNQKLPMIIPFAWQKILFWVFKGFFSLVTTNQTVVTLKNWGQQKWHYSCICTSEMTNMVNTSEMSQPNI